MTDAVRRILTDIGRPSPAERADVESVMLSTAVASHDTPDPTLDAELDRRLAEIQSGTAVGHPFEVVLSELAARHENPPGTTGEPTHGGSAMSEQFEQVLAAGTALSEDERVELADLLYQSLPEPPGLHPAWKAELRRRSEEIATGKVKPIPWEEVHRRTQAILDGQSPPEPE